jgi:transcriptional regulator GlxA family with amidase domain
MHRVAVIAMDRVASLDLAVPVQVFGSAHAQDRPPGALFGAPLYEVGVYGPQSGVVVHGPGGVEMFRVTAPYDVADAVSADTIVVPGAPSDLEPPAEVLEVLRTAYDRGARIAAICSGVFVLAAAGLLDGRRATTHWTHTAELTRRLPGISVDADVLFVDDGNVLTSAGGATEFDLYLHMVRTDFGTAVAAELARHLVMAPQRTGAQAQSVVHREPGADGGLGQTMQWLLNHLSEPLSLADIARQAAVSPRTLLRRFREQTGTTPLQWLLRQRLLRAQELLESTSLSVEEIAVASGFGTAISMRQHFSRHAHVSPLGCRRAFQLRQNVTRSVACPTT